MTRRFFLISLISLLICSPAVSQNVEIDSLKKLIATQRDDSTKVRSLIALGTTFLASNIDESFRYAEQARALGERIHFRKGIAMAYKCMAQGYMKKGDLPAALLKFNSSLAIYDSIGFKPGIANILNNIGAVYFNQGEDTKAIDFYLRSLRVSEETGDPLRIGTALNNIGGVYNNNKNTEGKALEYFYRALPLFKKINYDDGVATVAMNIGEIYKVRNEYDSAIIYIQNSLDIYQGTIDATFPLNLLGEIYANEEIYDKALEYYQQSIQIAQKLGAKYELTQSLLGLAQTQMKQGKINDATETFLKVQKIGEEVHAMPELKAAYEGLAKVFSNKSDFKKAYQYEVLFTGIKDSLYDSNNDRKIQQLQFNFDIEKKEAEIDLLTKDQALKDVTIQRQKAISYATGISGFLLLIVAVGSYNRYKYIRKTNNIIKHERDRSQELLLNILPEETARELEIQGHASSRYYENVTVLFTDFKGFSTIAGKLSPQDLVAELNNYFGAFDEIVDQFNLEKIKTIGDAYMCAGGIPTENATHPLDAVKAGLAMQEFINRQNADRKSRGLEGWELRIGIHTGPVVAGVVGKKKYAYDIWGDTVNIASRMESNGETGRVNVSSSTYDFIKDQYACLHRGKISAKNIGEVDMYFVNT